MTVIARHTCDLDTRTQAHGYLFCCSAPPYSIVHMPEAGGAVSITTI